MKTSARVLRLLALLQARREWSGAELAERLSVDVRTIRRDVERLRELGYVIDAAGGPGGGYRLGAGSATPPLLLDDEEAMVVAIALSAAAGSIANLDDVALRVLVKLDQLLPTRLRRRLNALHAMTVSLGWGRQSADPKLLATLAAACRDHERVRFAYRDRTDAQSSRDVEPLRLVHTGRVWYLAAWDLARGALRTFRVDRIDAKVGITPGPRFTPRELGEDIAAYVSRSLWSAPRTHEVRVELAGNVTSLEKQLPPWAGRLEPAGESRSVLTVGGASYEAIAQVLLHTGTDFSLLAPAESAKPLAAIATRLLRGVRYRGREAHRSRKAPGREPGGKPFSKKFRRGSEGFRATEL